MAMGLAGSVIAGPWLSEVHLGLCQLSPVYAVEGFRTRGDFRYETVLGLSLGRDRGQILSLPLLHCTLLDILFPQPDVAE